MFFGRLEEVRGTGFGVVQLSVRVFLSTTSLTSGSYVFLAASPGSTVGATTTEISLAFIADCINRAHKATKTVTTVLENMVPPLMLKSAPC
jgi:endonuclease IV